MARERLEPEPLLDGPAGPIVLVDRTARNGTATVSATGATISGEASGKRLLSHRHVGIRLFFAGTTTLVAHMAPGTFGRCLVFGGVVYRSGGWGVKWHGGWAVDSYQFGIRWRGFVIRRCSLQFPRLFAPQALEDLVSNFHSRFLAASEPDPNRAETESMESTSEDDWKW